MQKRISKLATGVALPALLVMATSAQAQTALSDGQSRTGQITTDSAVISENVYYYDHYTVSGDTGNRVEIAMQSDDFDTLLEVGRMNGDQFEMLGRDDDGGDGLNSRLVFTFPSDGSFTVRARTLGPGNTGSYLIEANRLPPPPPPPPPIAISLGQNVAGSLKNDSAEYTPDGYGMGGGAGRYYDLYELTGEAGSSVTITLSSDAFDTYLEVGGMTPLGYAVQQANDDGAPIDGGDGIGLNSRLTVTFQQAGAILIRATSLGGGQTGDYTLIAE